MLQLDFNKNLDLQLRKIYNLIFKLRKTHEMSLQSLTLNLTVCTKIHMIIDTFLYFFNIDFLQCFVLFILLINILINVRFYL